MKKLFVFIFLISGMLVYSEEETFNNTENTISKEVVAENSQQLDVKEIDTEELILKNQDLESSSVNISGENLKENGDKIKINQENTANLVEELSEGVEKKSFFKKLWDKLFN